MDILAERVASAIVVARTTLLLLVASAIVRASAERGSAPLTNLLLSYVLDLADGHHLHLLDHLQRRFIHLQVLMSGEVATASWLHEGTATMLRLSFNEVAPVVRLKSCLTFEPMDRQSSVDLLGLNELLKLLDLGLESKVGTLQVLDVLVLRFHGHDLHVEALGHGCILLHNRDAVGESCLGSSLAGLCSICLLRSSLSSRLACSCLDEVMLNDSCSGSINAEAGMHSRVERLRAQVKRDLRHVLVLDFACDSRVLN